MGGGGELVNSEGRKTHLPAGSLFCIEEKRVIFYRTVEPNWRFWWFLFHLEGTLPLPVGQKMSVPVKKWEYSDFERIKGEIKHTRHEQRAYGTACFTAMVYRWLSLQQDSRKKGEHEDSIEYLISRLQESPGENWSVRDMAESCHLSIRRFRDVFKAYTGRSPKLFLEQIRLRQGQELLRMGGCNVTEAADRLGYSSAFHFSRSYRKMFGEPPTAAFKAKE